MKANTHNASATDTQFHFVGEGTEFRALHGKPDGEGVPQIITSEVLDSCFAHGWAKTRLTKLWV